MTNPNALTKTVQPHKFEHVVNNVYYCKSANSGRTYSLRVESNLVFYTCQCSSYAFRHECGHGRQLCERLADGERFDKPRIVSEVPYDFDNAPLLDSKPAPRKLTLEEIFS